MIKFLHCADLHLDSPLSALDLQKAEVRPKRDARVVHVDYAVRRDQ